MNTQEASKIWIDADACPKAIRDIVCRAAIRTKTAAIFVANHYVPLERHSLISRIQVEQGFDKADDKISGLINPQDLVITQDIPLADEAVSKGALAMSPRGEEFSPETIKARLNKRDFMETMRGAGLVTSGGPPAFSQTDKQKFANAMDRWLNQRVIK